MTPYLDQAYKDQGVDMIFFMLTNIIQESTELLCRGPEAAELIRSAFSIEEMDEGHEDFILRGVVSRKKQLIPALMTALQQ